MSNVATEPCGTPAAWMRHYRRGEPPCEACLATRDYPPLPPANEMFDAKARARFWSRISPAPADACWPWHAATSKGYGKIDCRYRTYQAHRVAYEITVGPIPEGLTIDHLCRNRACCNPAHLEPVPFLTNMRRRYSDDPDVRDTHCLYGHELTPENTLGELRGSGLARCRRCHDERKATRA